jgi:hypothetical protein
MAKRFEDFLEAVRDSVEGQAKRKNYTKNDVNGENQLSEVGRLLEFEPQHGIGEIVYKCAEYLKNPREVLLIKIAGWAGVLWMRHEQGEPMAYTPDEEFAKCRLMTPEEVAAFNGIDKLS